MNFFRMKLELLVEFNKTICLYLFSIFYNCRNFVEYCFLINFLNVKLLIFFFRGKRVYIFIESVYFYYFQLIYCDDIFTIFTNCLEWIWQGGW